MTHLVEWQEQPSASERSWYQVWYSNTAFQKLEDLHPFHKKKCTWITHRKYFCQFLPSGMHTRNSERPMEYFLYTIPTRPPYKYLWYIHLPLSDLFGGAFISCFSASFSQSPELMDTSKERKAFPFSLLPGTEKGRRKTIKKKILIFQTKWKIDHLKK